MLASARLGAPGTGCGHGPAQTRDKDAGQPARDDHNGRAAVPGTHQAWRSARWLGQRYSRMTAWLDQNCGADGWAVAPSGMRGVLNDAISIYFADATLASAFVAAGAW